ncbi:hypothetical protein ACFCYM_18780 [Streptomyces sp. NPDC056254]|uniref:hypothetical protein n=1 Tax=Streptomyces sp. NPDC056254 TaxID=3345763 RepID=UPI0035DE23FB
MGGSDAAREAALWAGAEAVRRERPLHVVHAADTEGRVGARGRDIVVGIDPDRDWRRSAGQGLVGRSRLAHDGDVPSPSSRSRSPRRTTSWSSRRNTLMGASAEASAASDIFAAWWDGAHRLSRRWAAPQGGGGGGGGGGLM